MELPSLDPDQEAALEGASDAAIDAEGGPRSKESQATSIVRLVEAAGAELWHTPSSDGYISISVADHLEHYPLNSRDCKDYLSVRGR
jgi:hypothetical protein